MGNDTTPCRAVSARDPEDELAQVWERVLTGRDGIAQQEAVLMRLREGREDVQLALSLLEALKRVQRLWEEDYDYLLRKHSVPRF